MRNYIFLLSCLISANVFTSCGNTGFNFYEEGDSDFVLLPEKITYQLTLSEPITTVVYTYDNQRRITSISIAKSGSDNLVYKIGYNKDGTVNSVQAPDNIFHIFNYSQNDEILDRETKGEASVGTNVLYTESSNSHVRLVRKVLSDGVTKKYIYDGQGNLVEDANGTYTYDNTKGIMSSITATPYWIFQAFDDLFGKYFLANNLVDISQQKSTKISIRYTNFNSAGYPSDAIYSTGGTMHIRYISVK